MGKPFRWTYDAKLRKATMVTDRGPRVFRQATPVNDYYSSADKVAATRDTGGVFGSETTRGQSGVESIGQQVACQDGTPVTREDHTCVRCELLADEPETPGDDPTRQSGHVRVDDQVVPLAETEIYTEHSKWYISGHET